MRKRILAIGLTLAVLMTAAVWFVQPHVALANENTGSHLCVHEFGGEQCLDLFKDTRSPGQRIIWNQDTKSQGDGWNFDYIGAVTNTTPFTDTQFDTTYHLDPIYKLEKTTATGHDGCIALNATTDNLEWEACSAWGTDWVLSNYNFLVSVGFTNSVDTAELVGDGFPGSANCDFFGDGDTANATPAGGGCAAQLDATQF